MWLLSMKHFILPLIVSTLVGCTNYFVITESFEYELSYTKDGITTISAKECNNYDRFNQDCNVNQKLPITIGNLFCDLNHDLYVTAGSHRQMIKQDGFTCNLKVKKLM